MDIVVVAFLGFWQIALALLNSVGGMYRCYVQVAWEILQDLDLGRSLMALWSLLRYLSCWQISFTTNISCPDWQRLETGLVGRGI